ncbi:AAA family ATPase [Paenibacillus sp. BR2-3]|uniref:AAA family ATPase n=1 Tax=Paenibacillus sp. BR2-3 TaxID=3048494 RepID=UPI0039774571
MLTSLYIDNFKSLQNFRINFPNRLTVLIGTNSVGKSTVLQAIDLLSYFGIGKVNEYLVKHNWKASELRSKLYHASKRNMNFTASFQIGDYTLNWEFTLVSKKDELTCTREKITSLPDNKTILNRDSKNFEWLNFEKGIYEKFPEIQLSGSMLSLIDPLNDLDRFPHLTALKTFIMGIKSFELLSPDFMRKTSRYDTNDIGIGGERLGSFLHNLSLEKKELINMKLKDYYPYLDKIFTQKKQYGYVHLNINEKFDSADSYSVNSNYVSDGLLRIIAIVSLAALDKEHKVLLLDEIEDGINPNLAAELVNYLTEIGEEFQKQIVVTTHSPVMLNYFDPDSILFLWRKANGIVRSQQMFRSPELSRQLEYMNPGEVWLNFDQTEIEEALNKTLRPDGSNNVD